MSKERGLKLYKDLKATINTLATLLESMRSIPAAQADKKRMDAVIVVYDLVFKLLKEQEKFLQEKGWLGGGDNETDSGNKG